MGGPPPLAGRGGRRGSAGDGLFGRSGARLGFAQVSLASNSSIMRPKAAPTAYLRRACSKASSASLSGRLPRQAEPAVAIEMPVARLQSRIARTHWEGAGEALDRLLAILEDERSEALRGKSSAGGMSRSYFYEVLLPIGAAPAMTTLGRHRSITREATAAWRAQTSVE